MIIGFSGYARSGKDTAAASLPGFWRYAFADKLKDAARVIFGLNDIQLYGSLKEKPDAYWERTPREILQLLGTECLRKGFADDVWIRALFLSMKDHYDCVITDVRFPNEAKAIKARGGIVVRVVRPGVGPTPRPWWKFWVSKPHVSETSLDQWGFDDVLVNDGTVEELEAKVEARLASWRKLCNESGKAARGGGS